MAWPKGKPRKGYVAQPKTAKTMKTVTVTVDPYIGGHIPNRRMVRFCFRCDAFFRGVPYTKEVTLDV